MASLKVNSLLLLFMGLLVGCVSSSYKIDSQTEGRTQLLVTRNRVNLECFEIPKDEYEGDIKEAHLFSINVLDESKTVLTVSQGNILGKEDCFRRINKIGKILKSGTKIFIGGMGDLDKSNEVPERRYSFPGLGQFPLNGQNLQFMVIWNDKGMCYNAYSGDQKPCPSDEFPIRK
ncbi:MAG: hypothetical protein JNL11_19860 [Bdellovibrionaceae bacterium]|nr:hypothetical protein [Pseudobdellovibrionaceae bacterium]